METSIAVTSAGGAAKVADSTVLAPRPAVDIQQLATADTVSGRIGGDLVLHGVLAVQQ